MLDGFAAPQQETRLPALDPFFARGTALPLRGLAALGSLRSASPRRGKAE
jgi:hypothetical protein